MAKVNGHGQQQQQQQPPTPENLTDKSCSTNNKNNCNHVTKTTLKGNESATITNHQQHCTGCTNSSISLNNHSDDVQFIPITVVENDIIGGAKEILKTIRPTWNIDSVQYKLFTDGITNKLIGCFHSANKNEESSSSSLLVPDKECDPKNVVLIRIYGNKTDLLIDRKAETKNIKLLHKYGFAPSLYATFNNGLCYEYVPGCTLTPELVMLSKVWKLIACRMAEMHKVIDTTAITTNHKFEPMLGHKTEQFLKLIPEKFSDPKKHEVLKDIFLPVQRLQDEFNYLYDHLVKLNSPVVFSHNDLLLGNVIYTESKNRVTFIDYEYADYNYQAFDIGNHFAEFAGIDSVDYSRYPTKEYQLEWLNEYLKHYLNVDNVNDKDIQRLYVQVNQFALASHFFWSIWALIQAEHSTIDFDFAEFAKIRYREYLEKRDQFLALRYE